jgi:hypothetical protein
MENLIFILNFITDESKHFLLAFSVGLLGFVLMQIIYSALLWVYHRLTLEKVSMGVVLFTLILSILVGVSLALLSHYLLDYFSIWYTSPFNGAPLELINPYP